MSAYLRVWKFYRIMDKEFGVKKKLKNIPDKSGVYLFYDAKKELIYVGKATSLKNRVKSYFQGTRGGRPIEKFVSEILDIKYKVTDSVLEAIILEANLIKEKKPKYNILGRDDKSWNYIVITKDDYPRVQTVRQHEFKNVRNTKTTKLRNFEHIFGPYPGLNTKATMKLLRRMFTFSTCQNKQSKGRPCFYYQIKQCLGVCTGEISPTEYKKKVIKPLVTLLKGRKKELIKSLEVKMRKSAKEHEFEEAARLRNQVAKLQRIQDIALLNKSFVDRVGDYRLQTTDYSQSVTIDRSTPGQPLSLRDSPSPSTVVRIEGYDISNLGATGAVGSMVVFEHGEPKKSDYRKFKIKTVYGQSDVDCLEEVLTRRLRHATVIPTGHPSAGKGQRSKVKSFFWPLPNVFLIDGGKPQVNRAKKVLKEFEVNLPVVGIAKGPDRKKNEIVLEMKKYRNEEMKGFVRWVYSNTKLLIQVRDEAHRFAITYQKKLRKIV
jgi:excinuclease UvrABC nuclease subunit